MHTRIKCSFFLLYGLFFSLLTHESLYSALDSSSADSLPVVLDDMHDLLSFDDEYDDLCDRSPLEPLPWWKSLIIWSYDRGSYWFDIGKGWFEMKYEEARKYLIYYGYTVWLRKSVRAQENNNE